MINTSTQNTRISKSVLVLNAGSSSLKFSVFQTQVGGYPHSIINGQISGIGGDVEFVVKDAAKNLILNQNWKKIDAPSRDTLLDKLLEFLDKQLGENKIIAAGHRVVHGGRLYNKPLLLNNSIINKLVELIPLAPLHQPHNLAPILRLQEINPHLPQVACFDTAFHRTQPWYATTYAIPKALSDEGVCRYGFHGLSYEYVSKTISSDYPEIGKGKVVICHLGNGSSLCAVDNGQSIDTTMGFSALEGVPMGTRPGNTDPGIFLYLMREKKMDVNAIEDLLYKKSGLLGVSGISNDMRELTESNDENAAKAIELFCFRVSREIGALASSMQGLSAVAFTAGIGENAPIIREKISNKLKWLGVELDQSANQRRGETIISTKTSKIPILVIPTNEELMIAKHTFTQI